MIVLRHDVTKRSNCCGGAEQNTELRLGGQTTILFRHHLSVSMFLLMLIRNMFACIHMPIVRERTEQ